MSTPTLDTSIPISPDNFPCVTICQKGEIDSDTGNIIWENKIRNRFIWIKYTSKGKIIDCLEEDGPGTHWWFSKNPEYISQNIMVANSPEYKTQEYTLRFFFFFPKLEKNEQFLCNCGPLKAIYCGHMNIPWEKATKMTMKVMVNGILGRDKDTELTYYEEADSDEEDDEEDDEDDDEDENN